MQRKLIKNLLLVLTLVVLCLAVGMTASAEEIYIEGDYTYQVENGGATIVDVDSSINGDVIIPETLGGYLVTSIGNSAFHDCVNIESVTIPDGVTHLYTGTFMGCYCMERLYVGKGLEYWGIEVFQYTPVVNFTDVIVDKENPNFASENGVLYNKDKTELILYPSGKTDDTFIIPNTVKKIRDYAAYNTVYLEKVFIPDSVEEIGYGAFCYAYSLQEFHLGKNVKFIDSGAFHIGLAVGTPKLYIESSDAVFGYSAFGISESILISDEKEYRTLVESTKELSGMEKVDFLFSDFVEYYWEEKPYGTIYAHDESCSAVEYAKLNGIDYVLTHFYEDEWTYDYDNLVKYRKCIHCDELETEAIEPEVPTDPEEMSFADRLFDLIKAFLDLIFSLFDI